MKFRVDKILQELIDETLDRDHLGRGDEMPGHKPIFVELLSDLEIAGYATRYLDLKGRIAWKVTPRLRDLMHDRWLDAVADFDADVA